MRRRRWPSALLGAALLLCPLAGATEPRTLPPIQDTTTLITRVCTDFSQTAYGLAVGRDVGIAYREAARTLQDQLDATNLPYVVHKEYLDLALHVYQFPQLSPRAMMEDARTACWQVWRKALAR